MTTNPKAKGGYARAQAMTKEERTASARRAAAARWSPDVPRAEYEAPVNIGDKEVMAFVLSDGRRVLLQGPFYRALGRSRSPKAKTGIRSTGSDLPFFLQAAQLQPFISEEVRQSATPIVFLSKAGSELAGYNAELLPMVCEVYLSYRDACAGKVPKQYQHIIAACDSLMRGLARVGIIALIDEATGYQEVRDRLALQAILDKFLKQELASWAKRFPDEFYMEIFRLRDWKWKGMSVNRPSAVAHYTNDIVYKRLAPGILAELQARNPADSRGRRKAKHHQWLTDDVGHPALARHLYAVVAIMKVSVSWQQFMTNLDLVFPKMNQTRLMPFVASLDAPGLSDQSIE